MSAQPSERQELLSATQRHQLYRWARDSDADVVLVCASAPDVRFPRSVTPVVLPGCVGEDPSLGAALLACGVERVRVFPCRRSRPDRCAHGAEVFEASGRPVLRAAECLDATQMPIARRALLGIGAIAGEELPVNAAAPLASRVVQAHRALGTGPDVNLPIDAPQLSVVDCQVCGICTKVCPSEALRLDVQNGVATLTQDVGACTGELACVSSCPYGAIQSGEQLKVKDVLGEAERALTVFEVDSCVRCGADFPVGEDDKGRAHTMCPTCTRKFENPFSSWLPPGFTR